MDNEQDTNRTSNYIEVFKGSTWEDVLESARNIRRRMGEPEIDEEAGQRTLGFLQNLNVSPVQFRERQIDPIHGFSLAYQIVMHEGDDWRPKLTKILLQNLIPNPKNPISHQSQELSEIKSASLS